MGDSNYQYLVKTLRNGLIVMISGNIQSSKENIMVCITKKKYIRKR